MAALGQMAGLVAEHVRIGCRCEGERGLKAGYLVAGMIAEAPLR
jgi:hypothetical protein